MKRGDVLDVERTWDDMFALSHASRDRKTLMEAIACVDCALWDVIGKARGLSVCRAARRHSRARCPSSRSAATTWKARRSPTSDARWKRTARPGWPGASSRSAACAGGRRRAGRGRAPGARAPISCWPSTPIAAGRSGTRCASPDLVEPLDIRWFEEPCHWYDDAAMMARVRRATRIPVTAGQSEITSHGVRRLLDAGAVDVVNVDASECGGVTEWRRAAALCAAAGVEMAHHEESQISRHLMAGARAAPTSSASPIPSAIPLWQIDVGQPPAHQGRDAWSVSAGPGFGLVLDEAMMRTLPRQLTDPDQP